MIYRSNCQPIHIGWLCFRPFRPYTESFTKNNMIDDTQMDPMVGGEEEVAPVAPAEEGMEVAPEGTTEAGEEEAA